MQLSLLVFFATLCLFILPGPRAEADDGPGWLAGVNLAGAEFNSKKLPGRHGKDYIYPSAEESRHFTDLGMTAFRIPFRWERLQHQPFAELDADELGRLDALVSEITARGAAAVLDLHNYARYHGAVVGSEELPAAALADVWKRLAEHFADDPMVIFGLMNEPFNMETETWLEAANEAIAAIRAAGARNLVLASGNGWSGAHSWLSKGYGSPNAVVMGGVEDPLEHFAYDLHQYLNRDYSGTSPECPDEEVGVRALERVTDWMRRRGHTAFLGEFAGGPSDVCLAALDAMLTFMSRNRDVWIGWTYWAAGPWWGDYAFSVSPHSGNEQPQLSILLKHARQ